MPDLPVYMPIICAAHQNAVRRETIEVCPNCRALLQEARDRLKAACSATEGGGSGTVAD